MHDIAKVQDITWYSEVPRSIWKQTTFGLVLLAVTFGGFGAWAFTAPLAASVIAQGRFVATGQNKIVQHFEGGIIKEILVAEGDHVQYDQPLVRLDETAALVRERQLFLRRARLELIAARLASQIRGDDTIKMPKMIEESKDDDEILPMLESQELNFEAWKTKLRNETALLDQNIKALGFRADGYKQQMKATDIQLELLNEELASKQVLLKKGFIRGTEIKAIQRAIAEAAGQSGGLSAEVSETYAQITKQKGQILQTEDVYRKAALDELESIQGDLDSIREQSREAQYVLRRATINAPVAGTVIRLFFHTSGGVIESGKGILEILPADVPLIIEAPIKQTDIDSVHVGQRAAVRLTALNQRTTPVLEGEVFYVSADSLSKENATATDQDFYLARIRLPASELARVDNFTPTPGMPVQMLIQTAERTFFNYLMKPVADSMSRAFSEQ
ncbi:HlyD family type I secretion periplasmic adaptor subunit [Hoeflea sp. Naph1]|uniref:HlyD family type I secretion periplasmic adaptor subunit n=1 Tax=Hoeflea sp. Naph1 TaxID=3388653 RepID=UPI00398FF2FE